ncbi:hypothetical protein CHARACLAT_020784 [Characodon lateralis]|uniref:Uncharacterized protein n=1 Tax=Characodon lateralis TaxID=208331 RepID=A0ABU7DM89_9TELE|nr:hypothetical protein [Characodon lateralis]
MDLNYRPGTRKPRRSCYNIKISQSVWQRFWHNCKPPRKLPSTSTERPYKESFHQRRRQENHGNSRGAAETHSSHGGIS